MMNRRNFIKLTGSTLTAGLMPTSALLANSALAQVNGNNAKKILCVFTPCGFTEKDNREFWHPAPGTLDLRPMTAPLESVKQDCLFVDGLTMYGGGGSHDGGILTVLTGNGPDSIDVAFGEHYKSETPFSSLQMGPLCTRDNRGGASVKGGIQLPFESRPITLYKKLWGSQNSGNDIGVLSLINKDLDRFRKKIGYLEKQKLEQHTDSMSQLERRLTDLTMQSGQLPPTINFNNVTDSDYANDNLFYELSAAMQDIAVNAYSMGLTRAINFSFGEWSFKGTLPGVHYQDHAASHAGGDIHVKAKVPWMAETASLIQRLKDTPDGDSTLLDNTLVLSYSELATGNAHQFMRMPFILSGAKNWGLNTGTTIQYEHNPHGPAHHKMLTAIAQKAGLPVTHFGDGSDGHNAGRGLGVAPLIGLFS